MKKTIFALFMGCVSSMAFAQAVLPAEKIIEMVERNVMSADVEYNGKPKIEPISGGYEITVPAGKLKNEAKTEVKTFSFPMVEDGKLDNNVRYKIELNKLSEIFPSLEKVINTKNVTHSALNYVGKFVPALNFVESQKLTIDNLNIPVSEMNASVAVGKIVFDDISKLLSETNVQQKNSLSLNNVKLVHPFASLDIQFLNLDASIPIAPKASNPLEQILKTPQLKQSLTLDGVSLKSALAGNDTASFNLNQSILVNQNQTDFNVDATLNVNIEDISVSKKTDLPKTVSVNAKLSGFTLVEAMAYSASMDKLSENDVLPESPRKDIIMKKLQADVDKAYANLTDEMVLNIDEIAIRSDIYNLIFKGKAIVRDESFKGTLQVRNFDYLAPAPKVVDEVACQAVVDKMLSGKIASDEFQKQYYEVCEDGSGILEILRPYASTASKVKDSQGKDALLFDIQVNGENVFINGKKVDEDIYNPMELLD